MERTTPRRTNNNDNNNHHNNNDNNNIFLIWRPADTRITGRVEGRRREKRSARVPVTTASDSHSRPQPHVSDGDEERIPFFTVGATAPVTVVAGVANE